MRSLYSCIGYAGKQQICSNKVLWLVGALIEGVVNFNPVPYSEQPEFSYAKYAGGLVLVRVSHCGCMESLFLWDFLDSIWNVIDRRLHVCVCVCLCRV